MLSESLNKTFPSFLQKYSDISSETGYRPGIPSRFTLYDFLRFLFAVINQVIICQHVIHVWIVLLISLPVMGVSIPGDWVLLLCQVGTWKSRSSVTVIRCHPRAVLDKGGRDAWCRNKRMSVQRD